MQAGLFAKKIGMTQIFDESGKILPVTVLKTGLCKVSQVKTTSTGSEAKLADTRETKKKTTKKVDNSKYENDY